MKQYDLDVASPEEVARVLKQAAQMYEQAVLDTQAAWQDPAAGRVWGDLAKVLEKAAKQCEKVCEKWLG
jgi:hypothetical protein